MWEVLLIVASLVIGFALPYCLISRCAQILDGSPRGRYRADPKTIERLEKACKPVDWERFEEQVGFRLRRAEMIGLPMADLWARTEGREDCERAR